MDPSYATWQLVKTQADTYASQPLLTQTVTNCTNANPVQCTVTETAIGSGQVFFIGGGTGDWAALNKLGFNGGAHTGSWSPTHTGTHTWTLPVDSTAFSSFSGQTLTTFCSSCSASNTIAYSYEGLGWMDVAFNLGVAWVATGTTSYATKALQLLDYINTLGAAGIDAPESVDSGFPSRSYMLSISILYDWFYTQLSAPEIAATAVTVNLDFTYYQSSGLAYDKAGGIYSNYWGGHLLGFGSAGWATDGDNSNAATIISYMRTNGTYGWNALVPPAFITPQGATAAYPTQGTNYAPNNWARILEWMLIQNTANNENLISSTGYAALMPTQFIHMLYPNGWQVNAEGDQPNTCSGGGNLWWPIVVSYVAAGTTPSTWAQYYYQNFNNSGETTACGSNNAVPTNYDLLLWYDPSRTATNYTLTQPTYWYSEGDRHSYYRSNWTSSAIWGDFMGSQATWSGDHQNRTWGHNEIARGADWLLVSGGEWAGTNGYTGSPANNEVHTNDVVNTLWWNDGGVYNYSNSTCSVNGGYCGGQGFWGTQASSPPPGTNYHNETANYVYQLSDLTQGYDIATGAQNAMNRTLRSYWRSWLAAGDGTFVVLDRILKKSSSYIANLRWFLGINTPTIVNNTFTGGPTGASKLFAIVEQPTGGTQSLTSSCVTYGANVCYVQINDPLNVTSLAYMTFLFAEASGGSQPPLQQLTGVTTNFQGWEIDDTNPKVVVQSYDLQSLGNAYQGSGPVFYASVAYTTVSSFTAQTVKHFVTQITAGTYGVYQNSSFIGNVTVGSDGLANFTSTGGGSFTLGAASTGNGVMVGNASMVGNATAQD